MHIKDLESAYRRPPPALANRYGPRLMHPIHGVADFAPVGPGLSRERIAGAARGKVFVPILQHHIWGRLIHPRILSVMM